MALENLLNQYLEVKYQGLQRLVICPQCAFPLEETERDLHCKFCGWTPAVPMKFVPSIPDQPK